MQGLTRVLSSIVAFILCSDHFSTVFCQILVLGKLNPARCSGLNLLVTSIQSQLLATVSCQVINIIFLTQLLMSNHTYLLLEIKIYHYNCNNELHNFIYYCPLLDARATQAMPTRGQLSVCNLFKKLQCGDHI